MNRFIKKQLSVFLVLCLVFTFLSACTLDSENDTDSSLNESSNAILEGVTDDTSISGDSNENSNNSSDDEKIPKESIVSFLACPDNILHTSVICDGLERAAKNKGVEPDYSDLRNADYDFYQMYDNVADAIKNADISYINQETLVGGTSGKIYGYPTFNSPDAIAETIYGLGYDVVNVAHNHMLDSYNTKYLENCYSVFNNLGLSVIGYYPDEASTSNITVIEKEGIKISFLSYTYDTNAHLPSGSDFIIPLFDEQLIRKQVAIAKANSDVVIASCHWGYENTYNANNEQKKYAKLFSELEVDIVLGMHPHVIQPMEWIISETGYKTLVIYSLGNFASGMQTGANVLAGMFSVNFKKDNFTGEITIEQPTFIPIVTHYVCGKKAISRDTGYRDFKIYYLKDYTDELAAKHGAVTYEKSHGTTLVGGGFSLTTLKNTINKYIPEEFLPEDFKTAS